LERRTSGDAEPLVTAGYGVRFASSAQRLAQSSWDSVMRIPTRAENLGSTFSAALQ